MIHARHYTLEEASELLPRVVELVERMRAARDRLGDREAREALSEAGPDQRRRRARAEPSREGFLELRDSMIELRELEVVLRDLDRGLLDFPSLRDGREVYLCWQEGEDAIGFWHEPEAGFAGTAAARRWLSSRGRSFRAAGCSTSSSAPRPRPRCS